MAPIETDGLPPEPRGFTIELTEVLMIRARGLPMFLLASALLAGGCSPREVRLDDAAVPAGDAGPGDDAAQADAATPGCASTPTYAELRDTIFTRRCATGRCHGGTTGPGVARGPTDFTASSTRAGLVDHGSVFRMGLVLVRPGDPTGSFLMAKLTNDLPADFRLEGVAMPAASPWTSLPASELDSIRCWIAGGAP